MAFQTQGLNYSDTRIKLFKKVQGSLRWAILTENIRKVIELLISFFLSPETVEILKKMCFLVIIAKRSHRKGMFREDNSF